MRLPACTAVALLSLAVCHGCAAPPRSQGTGYTRYVPLPADLAAALAAAALRQAMPHVDPHADAAAPPGDRVANGHFAIAYECNAAGTWVPVARHRLRVVPPVSPDAQLAVEVQLLRGPHLLAPLGHAARERFIVSVRAADDGGARVTSTDLPPEIATDLIAALNGSFAAADDDAAIPPGLAEPNLRTIVGHRRLLAARQALADGAPQRAAAHLRRAARVLEGSPQVEGVLGALAACTGDHQLAREQALRTGLVTRDPAAAAWFVARSSALGRSQPLPEGAPGAAAMSLHTARRATPDPVRDYTSLGRLHATIRDEMGELACALLAREHGLGTMTVASQGTPPRNLDLLLRARLGLAAIVVESAAVASTPPTPAR